MTLTSGRPYDDTRLTTVLNAYTDDPLDDGDVLLVLDDATCLEITGLADQWDDVACRNLAGVVKRTATRVVVAVARPGAELLPGDYALWRALHEELRGSDVELLPVRALRAA